MNSSITAPIAPYRWAGDTLYLSGQVGVDAEGKPVNGTFKDETRQVFENIRALLFHAGLTVEDVSFVQTYLTDFAHFEEFNEIWAEIFPMPAPARVTVQAGLLAPFRIESQVIAHAIGGVVWCPPS